MVRGTFPSLFLLTEPFNVKPAALNTTESDVRGAYIIGGVLGDVTVAVSLPLKLTPYVLWWGTCGLQARWCIRIPIYFVQTYSHVHLSS